MSVTEALSASIANGYPKPDHLDFSWAPPLYEQHILNERKIRIGVIGAGFSGICAAINVLENLENVELIVYDKADDVGGVWHQNRYAGVACDVPSHSYQYSFCENTQWSAYYAPGREIHEYLRRVVKTYRLGAYIKLSHEIQSATWKPKNGNWRLAVKDLVNNIVLEDHVDFVFYATGLLSKPVLPRVPGIERYKGKLHHSGTWDWTKEEQDPDFRWLDTRVGVIGNGSSAVQIVPALQPKAKQVLNFGRTKMWLSSGYGSKVLNKLKPDSTDGRNHIFTDEQRAAFKDPAVYRAFRKEIEADLASTHELTLRGHPLQDIFRTKLTDMMASKVTTRPEIATVLTPDFPVGCKRVTPGPGYLESLCQDNVELVTSPLERFVENGIITQDGRSYELDMIICATGFDVRLIPGFPIYGIDGVNIQDCWAKESRSYLGITCSELPNFFNLLVTQAAVGSGSVLVILERQVSYAVQTIRKCQTEGYKSVVVKERAVRDFLKFTDDYHKRTVYTTNCKSWYKNGASGEATIRSIWPGSGLHCFESLKNPRWEDYDWEREDDLEHSMSWLGNGDVSPALPKDFTHDVMRSAHRQHVLYVD